MADVNIDKCIAHPKKRSIPATKYTVSFHAADEAYTLHFKKPETFGMPSAVIPKGGSPTSLPVRKRVSTGYCISGPGCGDFPPCPPAPAPPESGDDDGDPFEITIGSAQKKPKTKYKTQAKAAVKRAADVKAKAVKGKAKAKPTPKPKPKKKAAVKPGKKR